MEYKIVHLPPQSLIPYATNAKNHPPEQITKIAGQIAAFGFDQPIVVDRELVIIKGHGRREAAIQLNLGVVPVFIAEHLDEYQIKAARIGDNKVSESGWDWDKLKFDLGTLQMQEVDLQLTGFQTEELMSLMSAGETATTKFTQKEQESSAEKKERYESSSFKQILLIMDDEQYSEVIDAFDAIMTTHGQETNLEVVQFLIEHYENHKD